MINKQQFVNIINQLEQGYKNQDILNKAMKNLCEDSYGFYPITKFTDIVIDLLNNMFELETDNVVGTDIDYFIYELNFGKDWKPGYVQENGEDIDLSSADKLYDYIIKDKK